MSNERARVPTRIPTAWGDFWTIGDGTARLFLSEEEAAAAIARQDGLFKDGIGRAAMTADEAHQAFGQLSAQGSDEAHSGGGE